MAHLKKKKKKKLVSPLDWINLLIASFHHFPVEAEHHRRVQDGDGLPAGRERRTLPGVS